MKIYKGYNEKQTKTYALPHIEHNDIRCKYYGWVGMAGDIDLVKIDGNIRRFNINTHKEIKA